MLSKILILGVLLYSLTEVFPGCTRKLRSISELGESGVAQGDNLAPILFIFVIHAAST
jgi:hypothetical protein